jgi:uncharacterized membrane protein
MKSRTQKQTQFAEALGWFSITLGLSELLIPGGLAKLIGVKGNSKLFRFLGLRELSSGIGILSRAKPTGWVWSRVAGDAMDLALLGAALSSPRSKQGRVMAATAAVAGVTMLDYLCGQELRKAGNNGQATDGEPSASALSRLADRTIHYRKTIVIDRPPEEIYQFWRDFQNLPRIMYHLESVTLTSSTQSHWVVKAPAGTKVEWDAEMTQDIPNELIAWRSLNGDVQNSGEVRFARAPGGRGTLVSADIQYKPPGGKAGALLAKLFRQEPSMQAQDSLRFLKQVMETGEIATTRGQPAGRPKSTSKKFDYPVPAKALSSSPA